MGITLARQVPSPSASGWLIDMRSAGGPQFVVLRTAAEASLASLRVHLIEIGAVATPRDADQLLREARVEPIGVVW